MKYYYFLVYTLNYFDQIQTCSINCYCIIIYLNFCRAQDYLKKSISDNQKNIIRELIKEQYKKVNNFQTNFKYDHEIHSPVITISNLTSKVIEATAIQTY